MEDTVHPTIVEYWDTQPNPTKTFDAEQQPDSQSAGQLANQQQAELKLCTFTGSVLDFVKFQIRHSVPKHLSDGAITLLAYLYIFGPDEAPSRYLQDGCTTSKQSVLNFMSSFRKDGIVIGNHINPDMILFMDPSEVLFRFDVTSIHPFRETDL